MQYTIVYRDNQRKLQTTFGRPQGKREPAVDQFLVLRSPERRAASHQRHAVNKLDDHQPANLQSADRRHDLPQEDPATGHGQPNGLPQRTQAGEGRETRHDDRVREALQYQGIARFK